MDSFTKGVLLDLRANVKSFVRCDSDAVDEVFDSVIRQLEKAGIRFIDPDKLKAVRKLASDAATAASKAEEEARDAANALNNL